MNARDSAIRVDGLWKRYGLPVPDAYYRCRHALHCLLRRGGDAAAVSDNAAPWVLREVSFEVNRGETIGVIGRNGAGKSTLLKILAGVTPPSRGSADVRGSIFPMIELNAGIHYELTGRENMYLLGAIMGLTRADMRQKAALIEQFCELGAWFDRPVRQYSSGMLARLGFGVAVNVEADVLLVDEVLSVGDLAFQYKCFERLERLKAAGTTIVLVSHNIRQVARLCDRVMLLDSGRVAHYGAAEQVTGRYYEQCFEAPSGGDDMRQAEIESTGDVAIREVAVLDADKRPVQRVCTGDTIIIRLAYRSRCRIEQPLIGIGIMTMDLLVAGSVVNYYADRPDMNGSGWIDCRIKNIPLLPGIYQINATVTHLNGARLFRGRNLCRLHILPAGQQGDYLKGTGIVAFDACWSYADGQPPDSAAPATQTAT